MNTYIIPLSDPHADLATVGGKGMSLAILVRAGLPVPDGFHVTTEAYRHFVSVNELQAKILAALLKVDTAILETLELASKAIQTCFEQGKIPQDVRDAIVEAYQAFVENSTIIVAIRSSATAEDLPKASFAGQQETFLNIHGADAVIDAVKKCWASLWTARAIAYRIKNNIDQNTVALAVIVQKLFLADAAGIMFTANPINGNRDEIVISAAWGLGEAIVSGAVTPDTLTLKKTTGKVLRREIAKKQVMTVRAETGTREVPVPEALKQKPVLTNAHVATLARYGLQIDQLYGMPMDIEWALAGENLAILQARPITALPEPPLQWIPPKPNLLLSRVSFVELVPDAVSPLFATLAVPLATEATLKMLAEVMGLRGEPVYYFGVLNGYVYSCINTKRLIKLGLVGVLATKKIFQYGKARAEEVRIKSHAISEKWRQKDLVAEKAPELLTGVRELFGATADYFTVAQSGAIGLAAWNEILFSRFYNVLVKRKNDPAATTYLLGLENLPLQAEKSLFDLSQWAKGQGELANYLRHTPAQDVWAALQEDSMPPPVSGEFAARFATHLAAYGHIFYDLDFTKPVPGDDPTPLLETLKVYLEGKGSNPHVRQQAQMGQRQQAEQAITQRLGPLRRKWFLKLLKSAQDWAPERENAIADLGLTYPQIRRLLYELGRRLVTGGAIVHPDDVYWLEAREADTLAASLEINVPLISHAACVETRKADWQRARKVTPPSILPEKSLLSRLTHKKSAGNTLKGYGASAGKVTAPACILRGPEDFGQMHPGDVIVAVTTTPAWTPLFAIASGVVTDIGGPLSHSSIVAREYGIPAVMATGVATRRIQNGQMVTVDGTIGKVTLA